MAGKKASRQVALAFPLAVPHLALFMRGVTDYAREHGDWTFIASPVGTGGFPETLDMSLQSLKGWPGDGVITVITTKAQTQAARGLHIPVLNLAGTLRDTGLPRVMVDHKAIGRLAAEHLLECGLRRFAYLGVKNVWYSQLRGEGFTERVAQAGGQFLVHEVPRRVDPKQPWYLGLQEIDRWLRTLRPPVGVLAVHDYRARLLIDECRQLGLDVPNDVALIGVDNDETICEFCRPPLSSVSRSGRRVGYEAARLLDRLMAGKPLPARDILIPPDGVVRRRSTDMVAFDDPHVAACVRYARGHVAGVFGVERLIKLVPISRRLLEKRFRRCTGHTPYDYLCQLRTQRAKELLTGGKKMEMHEIATACGFPDTQRLRLVFRRLTGVTPTAYRRQHASHP